MSRILGILILILAILFFPPSVLALISNNAVPGDITYPVKVKLEEGIVFLTSFNPNTEIWFSVTRSDRRFQEASILLDRGETASQTLTELVTQTDIAAGEISQITDKSQKEKYVANLQESIQKYDDGLSAIQQRQQSVQVISPSPTPISTPISTSTPMPTSIPKSTLLPTPVPSRNPQPITIHTPVPTFQPLSPTATSTENAGKNDQDIKKALVKLEEIKHKLQMTQENITLPQKKENQNNQNNIEQPTNKGQSSDNHSNK